MDDNTTYYDINVYQEEIISYLINFFLRTCNIHYVITFD